MSTAALSFPSSSASRSGAHTVRLYLREARFEFIRALRNKGFSLAVIGFPTMFYLLFGVSNRGQTFMNGEVFAKYLLTGYAAFGAVGAALFGVGVGLAFERTSGWLDLKRASPMPPLAYLIARCAMAVLFSVIIVSLLCALGIGAAGVHLSIADFVRLLATAAAGSLPFAAMGLFLAMILPPNSAPGIVNMLYLPMSYASGLWIPVPLLPKFVQGIAPFLPTYHLAQLTLHAIGYAAKGDSVTTHILALAGFTFLFLGAGWLAFSRIEEA